ncbi:transcription termination factor, RNA polymerase II [Stygiomarasmius scandens]|uniref:Transcription termination factor, RNA polymerase II n=1 Tax=Marasmiellus scandens TaxID=2682957 RepID=A0ABR1ISL5_9AGAR
MATWIPSVLSGTINWWFSQDIPQTPSQTNTVRVQDAKVKTPIPQISTTRNSPQFLNDPSIIEQTSLISPLQTRTLGANVNAHELEPFGGFGGTLGDGGYDPSTSPQKLPSRSPQSYTTTRARSGSSGITAGDMGTQSVLPYSTPHYYNSGTQNVDPSQSASTSRSSAPSMKSSHSRKSTSTSYHSPVFLPQDTHTDVKREETDDNFFSEVKAEAEDPFQRKKSRGTTSASHPFAGPPAKRETLHGVKVEEKPFVSSTYRISTGSSSAPRQSAAAFTASHNHRSLPKKEVTEGKPKATPARIRDISEELSEVDNVTGAYTYPSRDGNKAIVELWLSSSDVSTSLAPLYNVSPPPKVKGFAKGFRLKPHQNVGRAWMRQAEKDQKRMGGILADEMGLGKTISVLVRYVDDRKEMEAQDQLLGITSLRMPTLIICPLGVRDQWNNEIDRFLSPRPRVIVYHRDNLKSKMNKLTVQDLLEADLVICTYDYIWRQHEDVLALPASTWHPSNFVNGSTILPLAKKTPANLFRVPWRRVVLDESQEIKNEDTKRARASCALVTDSRWALTGTPIQNGPKDLYSAFKFLGIKPLCDKLWYKTHIESRLKANVCDPRALALLRVARNAVVLRRLKSDILPNGQRILDLPDMQVQIVEVQLDRHERAIYSAYETKAANALADVLNNAAERADRCPHRRHAIVRILRLKQGCLHPKLLLKDDKFYEEEIDAAFGDGVDEVGLPWDECHFCGMRLSGHPKDHMQMCQGRFALLNSQWRDTFESTKLKAILGLLQVIRQRKEKTIVFSQYTSLLSIVEEFLDQQGILTTRYDGGMSSKERSAALATIKGKRVDVILMSLKAGGVGLNLTECNNVILVDLWWNPAVEDQAFGRVHRIGQTKNVHIYKLVAKGTIEERIMELQKKKSTFANDVLDSDEAKAIGKLSLEDVYELVNGSGRARRSKM